MTGGAGGPSQVITDLEADDRGRLETWAWLRALSAEIGMFATYRTHVLAALDLAEASSMTDPEKVGWVLWHAYSGADLIGQTMPTEN